MVRIRKTRWKVAYVVVSLTVLGVVGQLLLDPSYSTPLATLISDFLPLAIFAVGVRSFRGRGEPIAPPRAWWRMTSRPTAGIVIASVAALTSLVSLVSLPFTTSEAYPIDPLNYVISTTLTVIVIVAYVNSSVRLIRSPPPIVAEAPRLPKRKPIKL